MLLGTLFHLWTISRHHLPDLISLPPAGAATANSDADAYANADADASADADWSASAIAIAIANARHDVAAAAATDASCLRWKLMRPPPVGVIDKTLGSSDYLRRRRRQRSFSAAGGAASGCRAPGRRVSTPASVDADPG